MTYRTINISWLLELIIRAIDYLKDLSTCDISYDSNFSDKVNPDSSDWVRIARIVRWKSDRWIMSLILMNTSCYRYPSETTIPPKSCNLSNIWIKIDSRISTSNRRSRKDNPSGTTTPRCSFYWTNLLKVFPHISWTSNTSKRLISITESSPSSSTKPEKTIQISILIKICSTKSICT